MLPNAVKTTNPLAHVVVVLDDKLSDGVTAAETVTVMLLLFAVVEVTQDAVLVIVQDTISPLFQVALVYVALFVPTLLPLRFH